MNGGFAIEYVELPTGRMPAPEFVDSLDDKAAARIDAFIESLRVYGNRMQEKFRLKCPFGRKRSSCHEGHTRRGSRSAEFGIVRCQGQVGSRGKLEISRIVICEAVGACEDREVENSRWSLLSNVDGQRFQAREKPIDLINGKPLAAVRHQETVADFIEPQERDQSTFFGKTRENG